MSIHVRSRTAGKSKWNSWVAGAGAMVLAGTLGACGGTNSDGGEDTSSDGGNGSGSGGRPASGAGGTGNSSDGGTSGADDTCEVICGALLAADCPNDDAAGCQADCAPQSEKAPWCAAEFAAFGRCIAALPDGTIQCSAAGKATSSESTCASDRTAYTTCVASGGAPPLPANSDLGRLCSATEPCGGGLACTRASVIGGSVCTSPCDTDAECPENGFCLVFDGDEGHICARRCETDGDCADIGAGVRCLEQEATGRKLCSE